VARPKRVITQRDFSAGELREEFLERDDVGLRKASLKRAANTFIGPTQTIAARPGSTYLRTAPNVRHMIEIRPTTTDTFALLLLDDGIRVVTEAGTSIFFTGAVSWTSASQCWAVPLGAETIIGHPTEGIYVLSYSDGVFYYGDFTFAEGSDNRTLQPYYKFAGGSKITPSASTGAVTVTATGNFFRPETVGTKIRYGEREIEVTGYVSNTSVTGTVVSTLPPCFRLTVASTANLNVDDVVIGQDSGFNGVITSVDSSTTFSVLTIDNWDGPTLNEKITSPQVTQTITAITAIGPQASSFWDEQLFSARRGWPAAAEWGAGRLWLAGSSAKRNIVVASSVRAANDFEVGVDDDDAIMRTVGPDGTRIRHVIDAGDILFLADRGMHYQDRRSNAVLTPSNFAPVLFDERGCSSVKPALVERGVVFVEEGGASVSAALLDGNVYLTWSVRSLTMFCPHLVNEPVALCGPPLAPTRSDRFLMVVNKDGTIATMSYSTMLGQETVGFVPWSTDGKYRIAAPMFGGYWLAVDRSNNSVTQRNVERVDFNQFLDCAVTANPQSAKAAPHLVGQTVHVIDGDNCIGSSTVTSGGNLSTQFLDASEACEIGLNFDVEATVWPADILEASSTGMRTPRVFFMIISVLNTRHLDARCNKDQRQLGGYRFGDDLSEPPPLRTTLYRVPVFGRREHANLSVLRSVPGPWHILTIGQEVEA
jgi:hypothetical protein